MRKRDQKKGLPKDKFGMLRLKKMGFSDERLAELTGSKTNKVRELRYKLDVRPVFKSVDTCSAEFESNTPYMYSCYEGDGISKAECEAKPTNKKKVVILGSGPNRIGQGIEFDYSCVHAAFTLSEAGYETIMINCNPETVSTDYDTSDRLYFEPMTSEHVIEVIRKEQENGKVLGVIVQFGGQTALKLARHLEEAGIPIVGTSYDKIDLAEDRERFQQLLHKIKLVQPENTICHGLKAIEPAIKKVGYPVVIRPSNVLGGRAMEVLYTKAALEKYIKTHGKFILDGPILVDKFLDNAVEIDVDALSDGKDVFVAGIMQHIEEAGIHSGDSACSLPPYSLSKKMIEEVKESTVKLARALNVVGLMNVQYAVQNEKLYIIEVNPRASRTVPFVAKATGINIAKIASLLMVGKKLSEFKLEKARNYSNEYFSVKEVVFPFARFANVDTLLGPEMKSTGEVMGIDRSFEMAFLKAQLAAGNTVKTSGNVLISVADKDKGEKLLAIAKKFQDCGFGIYSTGGTEIFLREKGIKTIRVNKEQEGGYNVLNLIKDKKIDIVINTTFGEELIRKSFNLRRGALMSRLFYISTIAAADCAINSIQKLQKQKGFEVFCLQKL